METQLRNLQTRTGKTLDQLGKVLSASGLTKHGEQRSYLMDKLGIGFGDANTPIYVLKQAAARPPSADEDPLDAIYTGAKAPLRPLREPLLVKALANDDLNPRRIVA